MQPSVAVIIPCFKRADYTTRCIKSLEEAQAYDNVTFFLVDDGSNDSTLSIFRNSNLNKTIVDNVTSIGLRNCIIRFFGDVIGKYDYIMKVDNDCMVPVNWLNDILNVFSISDVDILSPNVYPSDAANTYGKKVNGLPYIPSKIVGGLWTMRTSLLDGISFDEYDIPGIKGAWHLLNQIIVEKEPKVGWLETVTFQDLGHWSGNHPDHIASEDHREYSAVVGRHIAW